MTRNEAVQKLATAGRLSIAHAEDLYDSFFPKPVVSQVVADWYEENKDNFEVNLFQAVYEASDGYTVDSTNKFWHWLMSEDIDALTILANMHQFGYEVEKEPRYTVRVKGINKSHQWLAFGKLTECWFFGGKENSSYVVLEHTRKELEDADFGWVFDCPGVEVKEVE